MVLKRTHRIGQKTDGFAFVSLRSRWRRTDGELCCRGESDAAGGLSGGDEISRARAEIDARLCQTTAEGADCRAENDAISAVRRETHATGQKVDYT